MRRARWLLLVLGVNGCTSSAPKQEQRPAEELPPPEAPAEEPAPAVQEPPPVKTRRQARPGTLAVSMGHVCALEGGGAVACWGEGTAGQLAPGVDEHQAAPVRVPGIADAVAVMVGKTWSCALRADHSLSCWGRLESDAPVRAALMTTRALGEVVELAVSDVGSPIACGRRRDGTVACGSLPALEGGAATVLPGIDDAVALELTELRGYVLRATGTLEGFALRAPELKSSREELGEVVDIDRESGGLCASLADGGRRCHGFRDEWQPRAAIAGPPWKASIFDKELQAEAIDYASGNNTHCLRDQAGQVSCWGSNDEGQLGRGTPAYSATPRELFSGPSTGLSSGESTCVVREGGELECFRQEGEAAAIEVGVEGVQKLALGMLHSCAIVGGGEVRCWGAGDSGAIGTTKETDSLVRVPRLTNMTHIAVGFEHTCAAGRDSTVRCWGQGEHGQLGRLPRRVAQDEPKISATPVTVAGVKGELVGLGLGANYSCAGTTAGAYCWGTLPNPSANEAAIIERPRQVLRGPVRAIDGEEESLCVVDGEGAVHCFGPVAEKFRGGAAVSSTLGADDDRPERFSRGGPLWRLGALQPSTVGIAVGYDHACVLSQAGAVSCWGGNEWGQLGDGTVRDREEPVEVSGLPGPAVQLVASAGYTCARLADGAVFCWGGFVAEPQHGRSTTPAPVVGLAPYLPRQTATP